MNQNIQTESGAENIIPELELVYAPVIRPFLEQLKDGVVKSIFLKGVLAIAINICDKVFQYTAPTA